MRAMKREDSKEEVGILPMVASDVALRGFRAPQSWIWQPDDC